VSAIGAAEFAFHMIPGGRKLDFVAAGGSGRTLAKRAHSNPSIGNM
jgi:hypothetical protein